MTASWLGRVMPVDLPSTTSTTAAVGQLHSFCSMASAASDRGIRHGNVLSNVPSDGSRLAEESFLTLLDGVAGPLTLKRIVSTGHSTPLDEWYDQDDDEWCIVLRGSARLLIEGESDARQMDCGDWVYLPRKVRHRVAWTDPAQTTVWLALHHGGGPTARPTTGPVEDARAVSES